MQPVNCYAFSGLGGNAQVFNRLVLPTGTTLRPLPWLDERKGETLADYARRLLAMVDQKQPFMLLGFSFGAAVVIEMAKLCQPQCVVLISGIARGSEVPFYLRYLRAFHSYKLVWFVHKIWTPLVRFGCGVAFGTFDKQALDILTPMIKHTDPSFYIWGIEALMDWQSETVPPHFYHIHGRRDRVLPLRYVEADAVLAGGHFIVFTHGHEIGRLLEQHFADDGVLASAEGTAVQ
jgi:hypothetical protein